MSLREKIQTDLNEALRSKAALRAAVLRLLTAALKNKEIEKRSNIKEGEKLELVSEEIIETIFKEAKKRKEAIVEYEKGNRSEAAAKEKEELAILTEYLPAELTEDELAQIIRETKDEIKASGPQDFGRLMSALMPKVKGRADGKLVSDLAKKELG